MQIHLLSSHSPRPCSQTLSLPTHSHMDCRGEALFQLWLMQRRNCRATKLTCLVEVAGKRSDATWGPGQQTRGSKPSSARPHRALVAWCWLSVALPFASTLLPTPQPLCHFTLGHPAPLDFGDLEVFFLIHRCIF